MFAYKELILLFGLVKQVFDLVFVDKIY